MRHHEPGWPTTLEEFRVWHERQPEVWEFIEGVPTLMAPGSKAHTLIKTNAARVLGNALARRGCTVLVDGAIVEVGNSSLIPDIVVTCAPLDFSTPRVDEPLIVVEILSPSGEKDDLGRKLYLYMGASGVRHYLTIPAGRAADSPSRAARRSAGRPVRLGHRRSRTAPSRPARLHDRRREHLRRRRVRGRLSAPSSCGSRRATQACAEPGRRAAARHRRPRRDALAMLPGTRSRGG